MVALKERLSLDWLNEVQSRRVSSGAASAGGSGSASVAASSAEIGALPLRVTPSLEDALLAYGNRLLVAIRAQPSKTARLHDLVTNLGLSLPDALPVVKHLVDRGHLRKLEDDPLGNYLLYLTDQGEKLLAG